MNGRYEIQWRQYFSVYAILYTVRDDVPHGFNGGYIYLNIYSLSAWPNIGIFALCKSKIPADIMGQVFKTSLVYSILNGR